jgi:hypothetical protein
MSRLRRWGSESQIDRIRRFLYFHRMATEYKCNCQHCSGHISFPVEMAGQTILCPHCQLETLLFIPPVATPPKLKNKNTALFAGIGFIFVAVVIGITAIVGTVKTSRPSAQKPDENLQEVKGAMGWNLGDVLPDNLQVKNNDDGFGITYDFNPPAEMENAELAMCYLILTEDRRIAVISVTGSENDHFNKDALQKVLKEKYGSRDSRKLPFGGMINYYFGQTNRQAVLQTSGLNSLIELEYRDEQLYTLAKQQQESRKAAANKQIQNNLKGNF